MYAFISRIALIGILLFTSTLNAESRGYSNNNPGNIVKTDIQWKGEVECDDPKFECFSSGSYGIRAIVLILDSYYTNHKINTIEGVIERYAPVAEIGNSPNYSIFVRDSLGDICGSDYRNTVAGFVSSILRFENGYIKNHNIKDIVQKALPDRVGHKWRCQWGQ